MVVADTVVPVVSCVFSVVVGEIIIDVCASTFVVECTKAISFDNAVVCI